MKSPLLILFVSSVAAAGNPDPALARETIAKWVETRHLLSQTRSAWATDREALNQSISLYEKELAVLGDEVEEAGTAGRQIETERSDLLAEQGMLKEGNERLLQQLIPLERRLKQLTAALPIPLQAKLHPLLARLPEDPESTKFSTPERVQTVVGILGEVEKFNASISVHSEIQRNEAGEEVQVRTLYLGLAQAYWVDQSGRAGIGVPGAQGCDWTPAADLAPRITRAIAIYENTQPAAFVSLPVTIR